MQTPSFRQGPAEGLPLTHAAFVAASFSDQQSPWVQMRRRFPDGPAVLCGQVAEVRAGEGNWFLVDTCVGTYWAEGRNVRMCSGDGHCSCEREGKPC